MLHAQRSALLASVIVSFLAACAPKVDLSKIGEIDTFRIEHDTATSEGEKAEELAQAAERLMGPASFMYANAVAQKALAHDPKNVRARFWSAVTAPSMELKGIVARVAPLVRTRPDLEIDYGFMINSIRNNPERALTAFALKAPEDIRTESELQEVVARFAGKLDELRKTLADIKNSELSIYVNDETFKSASLGRDHEKNCGWKQITPALFKLGHCNLSQSFERKMNRADFEMLQQMVAGFQTYVTIANAYDLKGLYTDSHKLHRSPTVAQKVAFFQDLARDSRFGTLRRNNGLATIPELARDAVIGVKYAQTIQNELCPEGAEVEEARPGYVFASGLCLGETDDVARTLGLVETMLNGSPVAIVFGEGKSAVVNVTKAFTSPVTDLRSQLPLTSNRCDQVLGMGDGKFGDVFPTGDLNRILQDGARCYPY